MKRFKAILFLLFFPVFLGYSQTNLEEYFNLCLEFGAPREVVQLFQAFRAQKGEINGTVSWVAYEDRTLLEDKPYSEYQIWYTIDDEMGLYQTSLIIRGEVPALQSILTTYLRRFTALYGEPVYAHLENGSILIFWYDDDTLILNARLILDIVNPYKYVSITYCSPQVKHANLLETLYSAVEEEPPEEGEESPDEEPSEED